MQGLQGGINNSTASSLFHLLNGSTEERHGVMAVFCLLLQGFTCLHLRYKSSRAKEPLLSSSHHSPTGQSNRIVLRDNPTPQSYRTVLRDSPEGVSEDSVQAVETIPKGEASSSWQLFPSSDSGNDVKLFSQTELCTQGRF